MEADEEMELNGSTLQNGSCLVRNLSGQISPMETDEHDECSGSSLSNDNRSESDESGKFCQGPAELNPTGKREGKKSTAEAVNGICVGLRRTTGVD